MVININKNLFKNIIIVSLKFKTPINLYNMNTCHVIKNNYQSTIDQITIIHRQLIANNS